jgi:GNAT superfamily N-acetyltransferase
MNLVALAQRKEEIGLCYPVMVQLRPQYSLDQFVSQVEDQMKEGYHLAYLIDENIIKSVAGFRISHNLAWGKFLYVDDLVSDQKYRHSGAGTVLFEWLVDYAKYNQCQQLHLDSGVQRHSAHRFYIRRGMDISSHHFVLNLV